MIFCPIEQTHWNMNVKIFQQQYCKPPKKSLDHRRIWQPYRQWYNKHKLTWSSLLQSIHTSGKTPLTFSHIKAKKHASGLERKLQMSLIHVHAANEANAPRKPLYRRIFRTGAQTRVEPMFVPGIPTPTELHGLIGMDHFRQRHLAPPLRMEAKHTQYYMQWSPLTVPDIRFTTQMIKHTLSNASHTTPCQDLLEYEFLCFLSDKQLERLSQIYNRWYNGEHLHKVCQGDFYALPNKIPHGPIANARPLSNFTTIWKFFSACLKQFLTPIFCTAHVIAPSQFALHGGASAIDTLRVIHDHILDRWFADLLVCMVFDDVRHAFGSVQHDTLEAILRLLHFPPYLISILMNASTGATLHMCGKNGITAAVAKFRAGIAQGCPMSALLFCILLELRIRMVLHGIPKPRSKCGDFGHVA